ncbi:hypothetical protein A3A21_02680 [Candidatus Jorgensenbacteria bacterium RIFCSPLOWO2_01_FULL_45_25b]|uniref:Uncharacterized protein n=1 Tax=Candidatus Jorgensenbacteria bacterium RIFCSPLOWO2_01_FULL_45_25b TaxID=1798471 RepID=A0A1F6C069_9BACT|nr:MAG: hypothetical protein A3A21_02680 [Candidatus Jorgensenbacteria bacterium RIFCSPLOWO2_01_FULL_45_25b]
MDEVDERLVPNQIEGEELSPEVIEELLALYGRKLGFLIAALNVSPDIKEAWIEAVQAMSLKEMEKLLNVLEAQYLHEQTLEADEKLREEMEKLVHSFEKKKEENDTEALRKIQKLTKHI